MKIFVTGTRGVPDIPGGVETHCQNLYPLIVKKGHQVMISRRASYVGDTYTTWEGLQLTDIFSPRKKSLEAIVHTAISIVKAKLWSADILHVHAVGPSLMVPFAKMLGLRVVMTNHGPDYDRQKWGGVAKKILKLGEYLGGKYADNIIVISEVIRTIILKRCNKSSHLVFNGVKIPERLSSATYIDEIGTKKDGYILIVARLVPEKGLHDLIEAFEKANTNCDLVIAGDSDHEDDYSLKIKNLAAKNDRIITTGYVTGNKLAQLFTHARLFVLPSYHEGLPIALLEAMSYGLSVLVSDIQPNLEVQINYRRYFRVGDTTNLAEKMEELLAEEYTELMREATIAFVREKYDWNEIADQTIEIYEQTVNL